MKILMLNTFDEIGGAARAASRLLHGVRDLGIDSHLLVQSRTGHAPGTLCHPGHVRQLARRLKMVLGTLPVRMSPQAPLNNFTPAMLPDHLVPEIAAVNPDIIHLHWLGAGFLRVETLAQLNRPLVWTLHDSWAFTGGCHVPFECTRYQQSCGACPVLGSTREQDLSRRVWARKAEAWRKLDLTLVAPSRWLADCARSSALFRDTRVEVIPNGLDTGLFRPGDRAAARNLLGLPHDRKIILFGAIRAATDPNKGLHLLLPALRSLGATAKDLMALVFSSFDKTVVPDAGMPVISLGHIQDVEKLATIYSAADVFVAPSLLENLPNTIMEAMSCGTPCVAFDQGGVSGLIEHERTGYLARPYEINDLSNGIERVLGNADVHRGMAQASRCKIESGFSIEKVAQSYARLYNSVLKGQD